MLTIHVWPRWLKDFLLTHPLYKSPLLNMTARIIPYSNAHVLREYAII